MTWFSYPGSNPSAGQDHGKVDRNFRGELPDPKESPLWSEFFANRNKESQAIGMESGEKFGYKGDGGVVEHEEYDQHTGTVEQVVRTSDQLSSGTRQLKWKHEGPRTLTLTEDKRSFD